MTDGARFWGKKFAAWIWAKWINIGPKTSFLLFLKFYSLVLLEIACNDSLQQCVTSSPDKRHTKKLLGPNLGQRGQNRVWKLLFCHILMFGSLVFLEVAYNDSLQQFLTSRRGKIMKKSFWGANLGQRGQSQAWN